MSSFLSHNSDGHRYANNENFNHAVKDFGAALSINPNHKNAKKYLIETLLAFGKTCEDKRNHTEAAVHYCQVLKLDPGHVEARDLLEACQRLMDEHKIKKEGDSEASVLSKSADKLRQLIQEDKKQEMKTKKQRRQSAGSSEKSKRRKRSDSSSSSSSEDRRRHKKESRSSSSIKEKKKRKTEKRGKRESLDDNEEMKDDKDLNPKSKKSKGKGPQIEATTAARLLPVSSSEYFSKNVAIPGLGSPPPPSNAAEEKPAKHRPQDDLQGRNVERPQDSVKMQRRDDYLMAEREKFYRDNKDVYKRSPFTRAKSSSSSSSSRSSRSPSCSAPTSKKKRSQRSQSKTRAEASPLVTGIKELDRYLMGAKELFDRMQSKEKPLSWALFSDLFLAGLRSSSQGQGLDSRNVSDSKDRMLRLSGLSKDDDVSTCASEDASRRYQKPADKAGPEVHQRDDRQDDRYGTASRRDSAEKEILEKLKGRSLEPCSSKNELNISGEKVTPLSRYKKENSDIEQLKLGKNVDNSSETVSCAMSGMSKLSQEREKGSSFREQVSSQDKGKIIQMPHRSTERNNLQPLKALRQPTDGVEKNFSLPRNERHEAEIAGLHFRNEKQQLGKQKQDPTAELFFLQKAQEDNQKAIIVSSDEGGHELSSKSMVEERAKTGVKGAEVNVSAERRQQRSRSTERRHRRSTSTERSRRSISTEKRHTRTSTERSNQRSMGTEKGRRSTSTEGSHRSTSREKRSRRSTSPERRPKRSTSRERRNRRSTSTERRNRKSTSTERRNRRSTSTERRSRRSMSTERRHRRSTSTVRRSRRSPSTERRHKRSPSTERRNHRSTSSERSYRRNTGTEWGHRKRQSTERKHRRSKSTERRNRSRSAEKGHKRSTSTEGRYRRSTSTESRHRRSRSTERRHRKSRTTERRQSRSTSTERRRKGGSVEIKRSRSRSQRRSTSSDDYQRNTNLNRQKRDLTIVKEGDRNGSRKAVQKHPVSETRHRNDQSIEGDRTRKNSWDRDLKHPIHDSFSGNKNLDPNYGNLLKLHEIGQEIEWKLREKLKQEEEAKINPQKGKERTMHGVFQQEVVLQREKDSAMREKFEEESFLKKAKYDYRRLGEQFQQEESKIMREKYKDRTMEKGWKERDAIHNDQIGLITKSKWDNISAEPGRSKKSRWDDKSKNIGQVRTSRWKPDQGHAFEINTASSDDANESKHDTVPLVKYVEEPASKGSAYSYSNQNVKGPPSVPHSRWETPTDKTRTEETVEGDEKTTEKAKTSESLSDLEKFLIDLKEKKKKQWIAEGKLKKK